MRFSITFKQSLKQLAHIDGNIEVSEKSVTVDDLRKVVEVEQFLEKLLGLRVHINQVS